MSSSILSEAQTVYSNDILYLFLILSSIAAVISLLTILFILYYKSLRKNRAIRVICLLCFSDLMIWSNEMIQYSQKLTNGEPFPSIFCYFLAFFLTFFDLLNFSLVSCIPLTIYLEFAHNFFIKNVHQWVLFLACFVFASIMASIPFGLDSYGNLENLKCYINQDSSLLAFYGIPLWIFIVISSFLVLKILIIIKDFPTKDERIIPLTKRFLLYPFSLCVCRLPASLRIYDYYSTSHFGIITYILMPLGALLNSLIFVLINVFVKKKIVNFFTCKWSQCLQEEQTSTLANLNDLDFNTDTSFDQRHSFVL